MDSGKGGMISEERCLGRTQNPTKARRRPVYGLISVIIPDGFMFRFTLCVAAPIRQKNTRRAVMMQTAIERFSALLTGFLRCFIIQGTPNIIINLGGWSPDVKIIRNYR